MVYLLGSYSSDEVSAFNSDNPLIVSYNVLRDAIDARWTEFGSQTDADLTSPVHYAYRSYDGRAISPTRAQVSGLGTIYFNVQIPPSTIDTMALLFLRAFSPSTVTVEIADDAAFTSNVATFAGPFTTETGLPRVVRSFAGSRYDDVEFIRIEFVKDAGQWNSSNFPQLAEFVLGMGRVLGVGWDYGSDIDPIYVEAAEFEARSGDRTRYIAHRGRHSVKHSQVLSAENFSGLDDVATVRAISDETRGHTLPLLYIPRPSSLVDRAMFGFLPGGGLDLPQNDFDRTSFRFDFDELPLFREMEG